MKLKNILVILVVLGGFGLLGYLYVWYGKAFKPNLQNWNEEQYVYIKQDDNFLTVLKLLEPHLKDKAGFEEIAEQRSYPSNVVSGKFKLTNGMNSYDIIQALKSNIPVKLTFNNIERLEDFAGKLGTMFETDSIGFMETFYEPKFLEEHGFTKENVFTCFLPQTYEFYWNVNPLKMRNKFEKEYIKFWNEERQQKAKALGLTPVEVSILASIVQKETSKSEEKSRVAGVYLNRIKLGMPLQADPTVVFAKKLYTNDFKQIIKRVYLKDTQIPSPYNTYQNVGLPPGPIFMSDQSSIDAVLNAEKHDYVFFCASVERMGYHEFAVTLAQHNANSKKYSAWLNEAGIN